MEFLTQARALLDTLKLRAKELEEIKSKINTASLENLPVLYAEEFELAVEMTDVYETLNVVLKKMAKDKNNKFIVNRLKTQADLLIGETEEY